MAKFLVFLITLTILIQIAMSLILAHPTCDDGEVFWCRNYENARFCGVCQRNYYQFFFKVCTYHECLC